LTEPNRGRGITENDVWQAADALLLEGARPTIERVRGHLGRGSPNTVSPYLDTWFRKLGARIRDPRAFSAPPEVPEPIAQAAQHFWESALATARAEVAAATAEQQEDLERARSQLAAERERFQEEAGRIEAGSRAREEAMELARNHLAEASQRIGGLDARLAEQEQTIAQLRAELAAAQTDGEALRRTLDAEREKYEAERTRIEERATAHDRRYAVEIDRARESVKAADAKIARLERESASNVARLSQELSAATQESELRGRRLSAMEVEAGRLRQDLADTSRSLEAVQESAAAREEALRGQAAALQVQVTGLLGQLEAKDREIGGLLRSMAADISEAARSAKASPRKRTARSSA
jgi:chromosome segregation ATPase